MARTSTAESWGRLPQAHQQEVPLAWTADPLPGLPGPLLPHGLGRSYGDSCLCDGGTLLRTRGLDRLLAFDAEAGRLEVEAGVSLDEINRFALPRGWFLPVVPGTKFVTVGGAIANDVHGKNHHRQGTFGRHVRWFELVRSDGTRRRCSPAENADWFGATIGGLGLTGLVTRAELALRRVAGPFIDAESIKFGGLSEFFELNGPSERDYEYTVSWVDCLGRGRSLARGLYLRGNHSAEPGEARPKSGGPALPFDFPSFTINPLTTGAFNLLWYNKQLGRHVKRRQRFEPFFWPLDGVREWRRIYGRKGFFQYQSVLPMEGGEAVTREMFEVISKSAQASFLAVFKTFGEVASPGWLSFPRRGITLAIDFPNRGERSLKLFDRLDEIVLAAGGALYPAKDARMAPETFRRSFPQWERLVPYVDPGFSSSFWRRVTGDARPAGRP
jgi:FAD/FMN-containing dehydrogenase